MKAERVATIWNDGKVIYKRQVLDVAVDDDTQEMRVINVYPGVKGHRVDGFGGAITAAVGDVLERMTPEQAKEVIRAYFGPEGNGYRRIRTHIDSCDFSPVQYCADDDPADDALLHFSIEYDMEHIIPWIKEAYRAAGTALPVLLSPWSPPAYMKTNGNRTQGGHLKPEYYDRWARYLCKYIQAYREAGILVEALSIQNEPNAAQTWDSCMYTAEEERIFALQYLRPAMEAAGLGGPELYLWDHNKERMLDRALAGTDQREDKIAGFAFHWYSGDHFDALRLVRKCCPDKKLIFSEGCIEYSRFGREQLKNAEMYARDMLGNLAAGMNGFYDWNICLDEQGGPNYVGNYCDAPIIYNSQSAELQYKLSYDYIGHCSKYILPGAQWIGTTKYRDDISLAAFENPDGQIVVVILNDKREMIAAWIRCLGYNIKVELEQDSIATILINP